MSMQMQQQPNLGPRQQMNLGPRPNYMGGYPSQLINNPSQMAHQLTAQQISNAQMPSMPHHQTSKSSFCTVKKIEEKRK